MSMKNHMFKHQVMEHEGREPSFTMKVIKFYKTPLARQVAEAIKEEGWRRSNLKLQGGVHKMLYPPPEGGGARLGRREGAEEEGGRDEGAEHQESRSNLGAEQGRMSRVKRLTCSPENRK